MYPLQALEHCNQPYKDGLIREGVFEEEQEQEEEEEKIIHVIHQRI